MKYRYMVEIKYNLYKYQKLQWRDNWGENTPDIFLIKNRFFVIVELNKRYTDLKINKRTKQKIQAKLY